ncbi:hypothetical protein O6H91_Y244600 [Diphasiastrum complanatum]|nr:hypothetical protein O6H91_Y244600 [Diphasiastrum complanatum]
MCQASSKKTMKCRTDAIAVGTGKGFQGSTIARSNYQLGPGRLPAKWWVQASAPPAICPSAPNMQNQRVAKRWHLRLLVLWVLAGISVSIWVFYSMNADIVKRRRERLLNMCEERAWMLQDQFVSSLNHVRALTALVTTFHLGKQPSALDQDTFAVYAARTSFERPLMTGVAYAIRVLHSQREQFEREQGWVIKKMHSNELQPAQDEYAPTVLTQDTLSHLASLDLMSGEEDHENILRARASGKGALTSPFRLLESNHLGVVLTFTVYTTDLPPDASPEERINKTAGYMGGAFDFESLVENLLRQLAESQAIIVNVYDITNKSNPLVMYGPNTSIGTTVSHISKLEFGDPLRKHEMRCRFYKQPPVPWSAITTSTGILVIVLLIGHILYAAVNRIEKVEEDYRKMEELKLLAESADVARSQFLATVSHEIRTPMNGVLGMLQMLMDTDLDATQCDYARTAHESGKQLIKLINEMLDQAKIESGRMELENIPFDLRIILDDILSLFSAEIKDRGIELAVFVSEKVPAVLVGDPVRLHQIITNLVGNSVKFTDRGHIFICVHLVDDENRVDVPNSQACTEQSVEVEEEESWNSCNTLSGLEAADKKMSWETFKLSLMHGSSEPTSSCLETSDTVNLLFSVEDTGVGIPYQAQERVFMPFMQADSSTSRNYGGTGIGLSISKCLVELMRGEMTFVSKPSVGTTFRFGLPLKKGDPSMFKSHAEANWRHPQNAPLPTKFKGKKALVVDGRPVRSQVTRYHLQRLGIFVEIICSNECCSAVSRVIARCETTNSSSSGATGNIDMVLIDKDAWGPNTGVDFPDSLKKQTDAGLNGLLTAPKLILLAMSLNDEEACKAQKAGFKDIVVKPLRASNIALCLQVALGFGNHRLKVRELTEGPGSMHNLLSGKHILVVDDNRVNRRVAEGALVKFGAHVECAESGREAIAKLQLPHKFDACFMDVQMPEMDGFEATRRIRKAEIAAAERLPRNGEVKNGKHTYRVPILAMTADVIQATPEECARCGMDGYVSKPFEEEQLYKAVAIFFEAAH